MDVKADFAKINLKQTQLDTLKDISQKNGLDYDDLAMMAQKSVLEARDKEARLRQFYTHQEQTKDWVLPTPSLDYSKKFKPEGKLRKNKIKQSILHEIDPALWMARLYQTDIIPEKITYEIIDGQRLEIPEAHQSTEHLQSGISLHDTHEENALSARAHLIYHFRRHAQKPLMMNDLFLENMIQFQADTTDAITFDYKKFNKNQEVVRYQKFINNDRQSYTDIMEQIWAAIAVKGPDRMGGMIMRLDQIPNVFSYDKQVDYIDETEELFMLRQTLEKMQGRYPELSDFFGVTNANLSIALRCFKGALKLHSGNPKKHENPQSLRIDIDTKILDEAFLGAGLIERDVAPMQALLDNYQALAKRKPIYQNYVSQIEKMLTPYLERHPISPIEPSYKPTQPALAI